MHWPRRLDPGSVAATARLVVLGALVWAARAGADPAPLAVHPIELRLPPPIVYESTVGADSAVVFRHETHVAFAGNQCTGCHPRPFHMLKPRHHVSPHRSRGASESCGICHDGRQAFGVADVRTCGSCHTGKRAAVVATAAPGAATRRLPKPIGYRRSELSPGAVTFRHETHTTSVACTACHPRLFAMKSAGARPEGGMHEASACGSCHSGKQAFGVEDADACARCHIETKGTP